MVWKAAHCSLWRKCAGMTRLHLRVFFTFSVTFIFCHLKSKPDVLPPPLPSAVLVKDLFCS